MPSADPRTDAHLAADLAAAAGVLLLEVRKQIEDPRLRMDQGDARSHAWLMSALAEHRPGDAVLSEEADEDDLARLGADRVWIVDPLDGTREFGEADRDDWAVHVALWEHGDLTAGAVALPAQGLTLSTAEPAAVPPYDGRVRLVVSRTRPPSLIAPLAHELDAQLVPMGSAGAKAMAVVQGKADAYVHAGGMYEWDSAAPVAVARAAGLHTSRIDGSPLRYNSKDPLLPDLLICRPELAERILSVIEGET